jgi:hypothetical protein
MQSSIYGLFNSIGKKLPLAGNRQLNAGALREILKSSDNYCIRLKKNWRSRG